MCVGVVPEEFESVNSGSSLDWPSIRSRAAGFPEEAFDFVREGVRFTAEATYGKLDPFVESGGEKRHVCGRQLCMGLRDFAAQRYGLLAKTVLGRWGVRKTDDFGTIVYALIDRGELRASENDSMDDFKGVFDFAEAFDAIPIG